MSRPRIVLDTNVLISAALQPRGLPAQVLELIAYGAVELCASSEILAEYREVFSRPKFASLDPKRIAVLLTLVGEAATMVTPASRLAESPDESDNRFYECADAASADYIVTGNAKHFTKPYKATRIGNRLRHAVRHSSHSTRSLKWPLQGSLQLVLAHSRAELDRITFKSWLLF